MPYSSKAQMRYFFAAEKEGKLPEGTARRWAHETTAKGKDLKKLPDKAKKKSKKEDVTSELNKAAALVKQAASGVNTATRMAMPKHVMANNIIGRLKVGRSPIVGTARQISKSVQEKLRSPKLPLQTAAPKQSTISKLETDA